MDRLRSIEVFVAAVELGSLAAAARRYGLTPAMASRHLAAIEHSLQTRLLHRTTRRLTTTPAGDTYYARCKALLQDHVEAQREASRDQTAFRGTLRVTAPLSFGEKKLGPALNAFMRLHPELHVEVMLSDRFVDLLDNAIDVALRIGNLPDSQLVARRITSCRMNLCASPDFLREAAFTDVASDLARLPRLVFADTVSHGDWTLHSPETGPLSLTGPARLSANNMATLLSAAMDGLGLVYGPDFVFEDALANGSLVEVLPDYRRNELAMQAVFPALRHLPLKVTRFVEHLISHFGSRS